MDKKTFRRFNLNNYVWVKLTEKGYQHIVDRHNDFLDDFPEIKTLSRMTVEELKKEADQDGYTKFQFHEFMDKFSYMNSMQYDQHFDLNVFIEE